MIAVLLAIAFCQVQDVAELRERYECAGDVYSDELAAFNRSISRQRARIQNEPNEDRRLELSKQLEAYKRETRFCCSRFANRSTGCVEIT